MTRVSSEKEKTFRENQALFTKFCFFAFFREISLQSVSRKKCEDFAIKIMRKFRENNNAKIFSQNFHDTKLRKISLRFRFIYFREKVCEMRPKIFAFFRETFHSLETLNVTLFLKRDIPDFNVPFKPLTDY